MSDAKQVIVGGVPISLKDEVARSSIGNLSNLNTTAKNNLVAAINEAAQSGGGEGSDPEAVKYTSQSLEESQKTQARTNIGAGTYSKPSGGIPASDLASGVVPSVPTISTDISADASSDLKTASPKAVKTYVDEHSGSGTDPEAVKYTSQSLTSEQKEQARTNIGAQDALVSGTNLKTINQTSLLGSGDITVEDGVGFDTITTPATPDGTTQIDLTNGDTITLDLNHNHPAYYSKVAETSNPSGGFLPDVVYSLGTLTGTVTFALAAAVTGNVNHYFWMFDTGSTAPTITWPAGLTWAAGSAPTVAASKHYEVSVLNGIAYYSEV